jgi:threonine dehydrogenase-like Zn-dependent dehydrogenase
LAKSVFGAQRVVVAGRNPERLRWLRGVGADDVITLGKEDLSASATPCSITCGVDPPRRR